MRGQPGERLMHPQIRVPSRDRLRVPLSRGLLVPLPPLLCIVIWRFFAIPNSHARKVARLGSKRWIRRAAMTKTCWANSSAKSYRPPASAMQNRYTASKCCSNNCRHACSLPVCAAFIANVSEPTFISRLLGTQRTIVGHVSATISRPGRQIRRRCQENF